MEPAKTTFRRYEGIVPNPRLRLREQLREVMRFKQFSLRTETAYWNWIRQFMVFCRIILTSPGPLPSFQRSGEGETMATSQGNGQARGRGFSLASRHA